MSRGPEPALPALGSVISDGRDPAGVCSGVAVTSNSLKGTDLIALGSSYYILARGVRPPHPPWGLTLPDQSFQMGDWAVEFLPDGAGSLLSSPAAAASRWPLF